MGMGIFSHFVETFFLADRYPVGPSSGGPRALAQVERFCGVSRGWDKGETGIGYRRFMLMGFKYGMRMISLGDCCCIYVYFCIYIYMYTRTYVIIYLSIFWVKQIGYNAHCIEVQMRCLFGVCIFSSIHGINKNSPAMSSEPQWPCGGSEGNHCPHGREKKGTLMEGMGIDSWQW